MALINPGGLFGVRLECDQRPAQRRLRALLRYRAGPAAVRQRVDAHMRLYYRKPLADMVTSDVPGYWHDREAMVHPGHPLHGCLFCAGPFKASYQYLDQPRDAITGRFASPYRSWRVLRAVELTP